MSGAQVTLASRITQQMETPVETQTELEDYLAWLDEQAERAAYQREHEEGK